MEYQYKVTQFSSTVTTADIRKGIAGQKISAQLELELQKHSRDGWELQGQYTFNINVKAGCLEALLSLFGMGEKNEGNFNCYQLVFRKEM